MSDDARPAVEVLADDTPRPEITLESYERWLCINVIQHNGEDFLLALRTVLQRSRVTDAIPNTVRGLRERFPRYAAQIEYIRDALINGTIYRRDRAEIRDYSVRSKVLRIEIVKVTKR